MDIVHTKIWIHAILTTKNFRQLITPALQSRLDNFIHEKLLELGCPTRIIQGMPEHVHILFLQNPVRSIGEIMKKIKGTSSFFINENHLSPQKFYWQPGYAAYGVSESQVQKAYEYISNQVEHHQREKFVDEYHHLLQLHGLETGT
jgi:REP element-mobilizing transposase RayT